jgi:hypothetical protein
MLTGHLRLLGEFSRHPEHELRHKSVKRRAHEEVAAAALAGAIVALGRFAAQWGLFAAPGSAATPWRHPHAQQEDAGARRLRAADDFPQVVIGLLDGQAERLFSCCYSFYNVPTGVCNGPMTRPRADLTAQPERS